MRTAVLILIAIQAIYARSQTIEEMKEAIKNSEIAQSKATVVVDAERAFEAAKRTRDEALADYKKFRDDNPKLEISKDAAPFVNVADALLKSAGDIDKITQLQAKDSKQQLADLRDAVERTKAKFAAARDELQKINDEFERTKNERTVTSMDTDRQKKASDAVNEAQSAMQSARRALDEFETALSRTPHIRVYHLRDGRIIKAASALKAGNHVTLKDKDGKVLEDISEDEIELVEK